MDISITPTSTNTTPNNIPKSPEHAETETATATATPTATKIHLSSKPLSFTNGVLKRHHHNHDLHHHLHHHHLAVPPIVGVVSYKECLKNHAAALGGHALDGCGEFMPSPTADANNPTSLKCAACGCHRNFHRREPEDPLPPATHVIEYQPHHRHHPLPPAPPNPGGRNSVSPPPISSYYPSSAPHMLLALSSGGGGMSAAQHPEHHVVTPSPISRKRFRTKFSQIQKEKMHQFAEKVGWKMQKKDEDLVQEFCNEIGVEKGVFKVWMHNNKNTHGKKDQNGATAIITTTAAATTTTTNSLLLNHHNHNNNIFNNDDNNNNNGSENVHQYHNDNVGHVGTNGSSSSS